MGALGPPESEDSALADGAADVGGPTGAWAWAIEATSATPANASAPRPISGDKSTLSVRPPTSVVAATTLAAILSAPT